MNITYKEMVFGSSLEAIIFAFNNDLPLLIPRSPFKDALERVDPDFFLDPFLECHEDVVADANGGESWRTSSWTKDGLKTLFLLPMGLKGLLPFHGGPKNNGTFSIILNDKSFTVTKANVTSQINFEKLHIVVDDYVQDEEEEILKTQVTLDFKQEVLVRDFWSAKKLEIYSGNFMFRCNGEPVKRFCVAESRYYDFIVESEMLLDDIDNPNFSEYMLFLAAHGQYKLRRITPGGVYRRRVIKYIESISTENQNIVIHKPEKSLNPNSEMYIFLKEMYGHKEEKEKFTTLNWDIKEILRMGREDCPKGVLVEDAPGSGEV